MKKLVYAVTMALALSAAAFATTSPAPDPQKNSDTQLRALSGQVMGKDDAPLPDAVVYLKNTRTLAIRSYIADKDGMYRFSGLAQNVDYEVHAEFQGQKSDTKTLSSFDSRPKSQINLHVDVKK